MEVRQMEIGEKLKNSRMNAGMTQEQIAEQINVSRQTISNWENGVNLISTTFICSLLTIYKDFSIDKLFNRERYKFNSKN